MVMVFYFDQVYPSELYQSDLELHKPSKIPANFRAPSNNIQFKPFLKLWLPLSVYTLQCRDAGTCSFRSPGRGTCHSLFVLIPVLFVTQVQPDKCSVPRAVITVSAPDVQILGKQNWVEVFMGHVMDFFFRCCKNWCELGLPSLITLLIPNCIFILCEMFVIHR